MAIVRYIVLANAPSCRRRQDVGLGCVAVLLLAQGAACGPLWSFSLVWEQGYRSLPCLLLLLLSGCFSIAPSAARARTHARRYFEFWNLHSVAVTFCIAIAPVPWTLLFLVSTLLSLRGFALRLYCDIYMLMFSGVYNSFRINPTENELHFIVPV